MSGLDPKSWDDFGVLAQSVLQRTIDHMRSRAQQPVWRKPPGRPVTSGLQSPPARGEALAGLIDRIFSDIAPYSVGNTHPRFWGWVHGSGTAAGVLAELIASALNVNTGGRDHAAVYLEREVIAWFHDLFHFPSGSSGILCSGTSMANLSALHVARERLGDVEPRSVRVYAAESAHISVAKALRILGLRHAFRPVPVDAEHRMDVDALREVIAQDVAVGHRPLAVVATVGTAGVGAVDPVSEIAEVAASYNAWLHVDAAFGAAAILCDEQRRVFDGIEHADSLAFDFHKWFHVPYDCGCLLVKDAASHLSAFETGADYLVRGEATAGGAPWFCDYGPELSRGFRALKVWLTLRHYGFERIGEFVARNCAQARELARQVERDPEFELLRMPDLNIVCFRHVMGEQDAQIQNQRNAAIVVELQESGDFVTSTYHFDGLLYIRVAICNHRTQCDDLEALVERVRTEGKRLGKRI